WNGARSFTSTSGAGISLMTEFLGLAYFAEIPAVIVNVQRGGPSTGMPTRTQQSDLIACGYASHGDTKHVMVFPTTPADAFEMTAGALDLAERLQTPVFVMTDLDLGMNIHLSPPLKWDDTRTYDRGKVLNKEQLEQVKQFGRYLDVDGDGICYRTLPGTHPTKGSFFTRGTSRDEFARYTEEGDVYVRNMQRLQKKWETAKTMVPAPLIRTTPGGSSMGVVYFGTSKFSADEALEMLAADGHQFDVMHIRAFPFNNEVKHFMESHDEVFVIEQNRDAQMRTLLVNELELSPVRLHPVLSYDGMPITADAILDGIRRSMKNATTVTVS
ncbi:MAG: 2-oxoacid:acceptor oxidoreductase subunit alpha, partial [Bacteroidota bacterium]